MNDIYTPDRFSYRKGKWKTAPGRLQRMIFHGLTWKWKTKPPKLCLPPYSTTRGDVRELVLKFLEKGIIYKTSHKRCYPSPIFKVPKQDGGFRLVIDLSGINKLIVCPKFKMQTVEKLRKALPVSTFFAKIDISDAFLHCPLHPRFQKFVAFTMEGNLYFFRAMPFGLNIAPMIYTRISKFQLNTLHNLEVTCSAYIDDFIIWSSSQEATTAFTKMTTD